MIDIDALILGFEPFQEYRVNPSQKVVEALQSEPQPYRTVCEVLPVDFVAVPERLRSLYSQYRPRLSLALGLASGRTGLTIERFALNVMNASPDRPDNRGYAPIDQVILPQGPAAFEARLPMARRLGEGEEIPPFNLSYHAGTFVCNQTYYLMSYYSQLQRDGLSMCAFVHLPSLPEQFVDEQNSVYTMPLDEQIRDVSRLVLSSLESHQV